MPSHPLNYPPAGNILPYLKTVSEWDSWPNIQEYVEWISGYWVNTEFEMVIGGRAIAGQEYLVPQYEEKWAEIVRQYEQEVQPRMIRLWQDQGYEFVNDCDEGCETPCTNSCADTRFEISGHDLDPLFYFSPMKPTLTSSSREIANFEQRKKILAMALWLTSARYAIGERPEQVFCNAIMRVLPDAEAHFYDDAIKVFDEDETYAACNVRIRQSAKKGTISAAWLAHVTGVSITFFEQLEEYDPGFELPGDLVLSWPFINNIITRMAGGWEDFVEQTINHYGVDTCLPTTSSAKECQVFGQIYTVFPLSWRRQNAPIDFP